ncbi:MAG: hypothetical protein EAZ92_06980 [Candidatus Kapaibacterium sp.]|nr:MAG: hypothetical protein EAZ92_06980 [Candidatus Kapabacteria bacterium]
MRGKTSDEYIQELNISMPNEYGTEKYNQFMDKSSFFRRKNKLLPTFAPKFLAQRRIKKPDGL